MPYKINATIIKEWFQYSCDRKFLYSASKIEKHRPIPLRKNPNPPSNHAGNIYEQEVVKALQEEFPMTDLDPKTIDQKKYRLLWHRFLNCFDQSPVAYSTQVRVEGLHLAAYYQLPKNVQFNHGYIDLLKRFEQDGQTYLQIIDVKNSPVATHFHRIQVAYYALLLQQQLQILKTNNEITTPLKIHPVGAIWKTSEDPNKLWESEEFNLRTYQRELKHFIDNDLDRLSQVSIHPQDNSKFHLYYKCEQCKYQPHCHQNVEKPQIKDLDLSAIYGLTQYSKQKLQEKGFTTIGQVEQLLNPSRGT